MFVFCVGPPRGCDCNQKRRQDAGGTKTNRQINDGECSAYDVKPKAKERAGPSSAKSASLGMTR